MSTLENLIEHPEEWEEPVPEEQQTRAHKSKVVVASTRVRV